MQVTVDFALISTLIAVIITVTSSFWKIFRVIRELEIRISLVEHKLELECQTMKAKMGGVTKSLDYRVVQLENFLQNWTHEKEGHTFQIRRIHSSDDSGIKWLEDREE